MKPFVIKIFLLIFCTLDFGHTPAFTSERGRSPTPKLDRLKIVGNRKISSHRIQKWFGVRKGDFISEDDIGKRGREVLKQFIEQGFYLAKFDSIVFLYPQDSTRIDITIYVDEGNKIKVGEITITGIDDKKDQLLDGLKTRAGADFKEEILQEDIETFLQYYEEKGYPYCKVSIADLHFNSSNSKEASRINIELEVEPGAQITIDEVEILGNEQTKETVILRELPLRIGDIYNQRDVDKIQSKLQKLDYFKWVNPPRLELLKNNSGKLIIELAEGRHNRLDGVIGYNPGTQTSKGFVTGLLDVSFGNLFGTGRQIEAHWQRRTEKTQELRLRYLEPWLAGLPLNAGFSFEQLIQDTSYVQRNLALDFRYLVNENLSFFSQISKRDISPDSLGVLRFGIPKSSSLNLAAGVSFNTLDNLLNPRKGLSYTSSFEWGRKKVEEKASINKALDSSLDQKRLSIDFETYFPLFRWQVLALAVHGRQVTSDEPVVPITELYRFGGTQTLRGYREEQFRGSRIAWTNIEYRYLLGRFSRFFTFVDFGYFFREDIVNDTVLKVQNWKVGYGLGLRIDTRLGLFGIDYGLGEDDRFSNGKVHIRLANEF